MSRANREDNVVLSKKLSRALRHQAVAMGLNIRDDGHVSVPEILRHRDFQGYTVDNIKAVIAGCDKQRFELSVIGGVEMIRAVQGHTLSLVKDEELLEIITDSSEVPLCIHGTYRKFIDSIMANGLKRMSRNHMHFAPGMPADDEVISGMRRSCEVMISVDVPKAMESGMKFYRSKNNVILTSGFEGTIPSSFFKEVIYVDKRNKLHQVKSGSVQLASLPQQKIRAVQSTPSTASSASNKAAVEGTLSNSIRTTIQANSTSSIAQRSGNSDMPFPGVWKRTALYEPKGTLGPANEQTMNAIWVQSEFGLFIDLRTPPAVTHNADGSIAEHDKRQCKSFAGISKFDRTNSHLAWTRIIDYRGIPCEDVGVVHHPASKGFSTIPVDKNTLIEDSVLPGDDFREIWEKQTATATATDGTSVFNAGNAKSWSKIVAPAGVVSGSNKTWIENSSEQVACILVHKPTSADGNGPVKDTANNGNITNQSASSFTPSTAEQQKSVAGYFLIVDGQFALTINLRPKLAGSGVLPRPPTVAELKAYFDSQQQSSAPDTATEVSAVVPANASVDTGVQAAAVVPKTIFSYASIAANKSSNDVSPSSPISAAAPFTNKHKTVTSSSTTNRALTSAEIELYLSQYVTVIGTVHDWKIQHSLDARMIGQSLLDVSVPVPAVNGSALETVKLIRLFKDYIWVTESGRVPKELIHKQRFENKRA